MSFFQEKDHFITKAFDDIFNCDSDDDTDDDVCENAQNSLDDSSKKSEPEKEKHAEATKQVDLIIDVDDDDDDDDYNEVKSNPEPSPDKRLKLNEAGDAAPGSQKPQTQSSSRSSSPLYLEPVESQSGLRRSSRTCVRKKAVLRQVSRRNSSKRNKSQRRNNPENGDDVIILSSGEDDDVISDNNISINSSSQNRSTICQDPDDYDFKLKITLAGSYRQYSTTYKTKLVDALKSLIDEISENDETLIIQSPAGQTISLMESPYSLNLSPGDILKAIEISLNNNNRANKDNCDTSHNPNEILVKVQDGNRKNTKEFRIMKNIPLVRLKERYAKELNLNSIEQIKFSFDGDIVEDESTPEELEIEDDCVIDVMITS